MTHTPLKAPFPWFGGKSKIAHIIWQAFGDVPNTVEPFFGSGAVLLARPGWHESVSWLETVNDIDGMVSNFWRALQSDPDAVAEYADWPVNENDLHARHAWLVGKKESLQASLECDPEYYDAKIAGWWVWGISCWIGGGFCSGQGPWSVVDGRLVHLGNAGKGIHRKLVHLGDAGQGIHRQLVHLGNAGQGIHRQLVHLGDAGQGIHRKRANALISWMHALRDRMRRVRVCCGDWSRVCGPTPTIKHGLTGVFLDPPYGHDQGRYNNIYSHEADIGDEIRGWCADVGGNPLMRVALCGYGNEHDSLLESGWRRHEWSAHGGYGSQSKNPHGRGRENKHRETIWFSPHCNLIENERQMTLW